MSEQTNTDGTSPDASARSEQALDEYQRQAGDECSRALAEQRGGLWEAVGLAMVLTYDGRVECVNSSLLSLLGYSKAELVGREASLVYGGSEGWSRLEDDAYRMLGRGEAYAARLTRLRCS